MNKEELTGIVDKCFDSRAKRRGTTRLSIHATYKRHRDKNQEKRNLQSRICNYKKKLKELEKQYKEFE